MDFCAKNKKSLHRLDLESNACHYREISFTLSTTSLTRKSSFLKTQAFLEHHTAQHISNQNNNILLFSILPTSDCIKNSISATTECSSQGPNPRHTITSSQIAFENGKYSIKWSSNLNIDKKNTH